jgi:hypothetical protein
LQIKRLYVRRSNLPVRDIAAAILGMLINDGPRLHTGIDRTIF